MDKELLETLENLVNDMLFEIELVDFRGEAINAKSHYTELITQAVWNRFLGADAELVVIDPMIFEKYEEDDIS